MPLTFLPTETLINVTLRIIDDTVLEGDEQVVLEASVVEGEGGVDLQQPNATIEIQDEDSEQKVDCF